MTDATHGVKEYEFDLAISLRDTDVAVAAKIANALKDKFNVFLYSENEKDIKYRDGVKALSDIYRYKSRGVLVLLRPDWGETNWTRVESDVLSARRLLETANFLLVMPMEKMEVPGWLTPTYIYEEFEKRPFEFLLGAIFGKLGELKAEVRELSALELAQKHQSELNWKRQHEKLLFGNEALAAVVAATEDLNRLIEQYKDEINPTFAKARIQAERDGRSITIARYPCSVVLRAYENTTDHPYVRRMVVTEYDGIHQIGTIGRTPFEPMSMHEGDYAIDVDQENNWFWRDMKTKRVLTTHQLVEVMFKRLLERTKKFQNNELTVDIKARRDPLDNNDNYQVWKKRF